MNGREFVDIIEHIDPELISEAEKYNAKKKHTRWELPACAAACLCLTVVGAAALRTWRSAPTKPDESSVNSFALPSIEFYDPDRADDPLFNPIEVTDGDTVTWYEHAEGLPGINNDGGAPQNDGNSYSSDNEHANSEQNDSDRKILSTEITEMSVTHEQALSDELFGRYFVGSIPEGFSAENISISSRDGETISIRGLWTREYSEICWIVRSLAEEDLSRLTAADALENYDLSLYPIPFCDSVPDEIFEIVNDPIFDLSELSPEVIGRRVIAGDEQQPCCFFSVRSGDVLIRVRTKGVDPAWISEQFSLID